MGPTLTAGLDAQASQTMRILCLAGIVVGLVLGYVTANRLRPKTRHALAAVSCLLPALPCALPPALAGHEAVFGALMVAAGIGAAVVLGRIGAIMSTLPRTQTIIIICASSTIGGVAALAVGSAPAPTSLLLIAALVPAAAAIAAIACKECPAEDEVGAKNVPLDGAAARALARRYRFLFLAMLFYGFVFGMVVAASESIGAASGSHSLTVSVFWVPGILLLAAFLILRVRIDLESIQRLIIALSLAGFIPLIIVDDPGQQTLCIAVLSVAFWVFGIANFASLFDIIQEHGLEPLRTFFGGRIFAEAGIPLGWAFGMVMESSSLPRFELRLAIVVVFGAVTALGLAFASRNTDEKPPRDRSDDASIMMPKTLKRIFRNNMMELARRHELSPRESEVFTLLAAGRTPKWIGQHLLISDSTVKSHMYRIYAKFDVHTQQELLDAVDAWFEEEAQDQGADKPCEPAPLP